jgi:drug/metabolite transporter (DMT)-like permease
MARFARPARHEGDAAAGEGVSTDQDHLPRRLWWVLAGLTFAWGFNWTAMKVALGEVPPWTFRTLCLGFGSAVLFLALRLGGQRLAVPRSQWGRLAMLAFFNITCWNVLIAFGMTMIPSGRAAILAYTMPALAIPLSVWILGERLTPRKLTGLALGMAGLGLVLGEAGLGLGNAPVGSLLVLGAAASWALGVVLQKRYPMSMPAGAYSAWIMLLGGVPIFACALAFDDLGVLGTVGLWPALGVLYNVLIAFAWAHWAWIKLATSVSVTVFSLSMLVIPVIGVISGMLFLGERPSWAEYGALGLVLGSLFSVAVPRRAARV